MVVDANPTPASDDRKPELIVPLSVAISRCLAAFLLGYLLGVNGLGLFTLV